MYRFVHLSDIHFGQEKDGQLVVHEDARAELIRDCKDRKDEIGPADYVIVTGDTAYSGAEDEYKKAGAWLDSVCIAAGCDRTKVLVIPGNHDVSVSSINYSTELLQNTIRNGTAEQAQAHLYGLASKGETSPLLDKLRDYQKFALSYGCEWQSDACPMWTKVLPIGSQQQFALRLIGTNSVQVSDLTDRKGRMVLGNNQFVIQREDGVENIFLVHHPLEWFLDKSDAERHITTRGRLVMYGHEHYAGVSVVRNSASQEVIHMAAGATNPPECGGEYTFSYNWLEIDVVNEHTEPQLNLRVYPRVWSHRYTEFAPDHHLMKLDAQLKREFSVPCPEFARGRYSAAPSQPKSNSHERPIELIQVEQVGQSNTELNSTGQVTSGMDSRNSIALARIKLLFWRHLDRKQRTAVLLELRLIPGEPIGNLSQNVENQALAKALTENLLKEFWRAMVPLLPENERKRDPFSDSEGDAR